MKDGRDRTERTDGSGDSWLIDSEGKYVRDHNGRKIPGAPQELTTDGGFTHYDSSRGHCGLCGSLMCHGSCFK
jgi:hypothetical protein